MTDKLYFYSKSKDVPPGEGTNEYVADSAEYSDLKTIKDWRKILSNFHMYPFTYNGFTYNSIEHVFQAKKIELVDKEKALWFTIESGHPIGTGSAEMARKNRKLVLLKPEQLAEWALVKAQIMFEAAYEKYKVYEEGRTVLKATKKAELWHIVCRSKPVLFDHLMSIRDMLS